MRITEAWICAGLNFTIVKALVFEILLGDQQRQLVWISDSELLHDDAVRQLSSIFDTSRPGTYSGDAVERQG